MERKYWKSQRNLSVQKCGNHVYIQGCYYHVPNMHLNLELTCKIQGAHPLGALE